MSNVFLVMARPIEPTPILYGEDAKRLLDDMANLKYSKEKEEFLKRADEAYEKYILPMRERERQERSKSSPK